MMYASSQVGKELTQVERLMLKLNISRDEAENMIALDDEIEHGADPFPQSQEQKEVSKKMCGTGTAERKKPVKRERKIDNDKREIIQALDEALCDLVDNVEVVNPEREIICEFNGRKFKVVLSAPRS